MKSVVYSNLELRSSSCGVDPYNFWLFGAPSVATSVLLFRKELRFQLLVETALWRIQITEVYFSTFLYDAS